MPVLAPHPPHQTSGLRFSDSEIAVALYATGKNPARLTPSALARLADAGMKRLGGRQKTAEAARRWASFNTMLTSGQIDTAEHAALMGVRWPDRARLDSCLAAARTVK